MPPKGFKKNTPVRDIVFSFRVTKEECNILTKAMKAMKMNRQNFLRTIILGGNNENLLHER